MSGEFRGTTKNIGVHDKGKGLLLETETVYTDGKGAEVCKTVGATYVRTMTGFESKGKTYSMILKRPARAPDRVVEMETSPFQAELYRVNGDYNVGVSSIAPHHE